ncbi:MAG: YihY/virulence factor BrkB family protein, partial [Propionibacterium sp.]|nr:YihY/virulence factor BrkB family protein [Propionibacterium sp.]
MAPTGPDPQPAPPGPAAAVHVEKRPIQAPGFRHSLETPGLMPRIQAVTAWWNRTRPARMLARYGARNGGLLCSGMALTVLLSLTAALTVGGTVFMAALGSNTELRDAVVDGVNSALPGLLTTADSPGLIDPQSLTATSVWSLTSVVALLVMTWSAISAVGAMGTSIRAMFGLVAVPENIVVKTLRNVAGVVGLALSLVAGAGLGLAVTVFGDWTSQRLDLQPGLGEAVLLGASYLVSMLVNAGVIILFVRVVAGVRVVGRDLATGTALFVVASEVLRYLGTSAVGSVSGPLLTTATSLVTLILWI